MRSSLQDLSNLKVGILGGGQLGWMMIVEGRRYPIKFYVMDQDPRAPACVVADRCYSPQDYKDMIDSVDVVTYEFEHVYDAALKYAEEVGKLVPKLNAIVLKRERWMEKEFYRRCDIPTPRFYIVHGIQEALRIVKNEFNYYCVIKQSRGGYDGKGQYFIRSRDDLNKNLNILLQLSNEILVVEEIINYDYEASIIVVRDIRGSFAYYPPTYNYNEGGILIYNYGPLENKTISQEIVRIANEITTMLNYVGVMGIEFFIKDGKVLVNEFAPRVHNTGHYTLDAAMVSQFEQHLRVIIGIDVGDTTLLTYGGMVNILGLAPNEVPLDVMKCGKVYWYGKREVRKRRKMGHVNVVGRSLDEVKLKINTIMKLLYPRGVQV